MINTKYVIYPNTCLLYHTKYFRSTNICTFAKKRTVVLQPRLLSFCLFSICLLSRGSFNRANACASSAIYALICVDFILSVFLSYAGNGTFVCTCSGMRCMRLISDMPLKTPPYTYVSELYHIAKKIIKQFIAKT